MGHICIQTTRLAVQRGGALRHRLETGKCAFKKSDSCVLGPPIAGRTNRRMPKEKHPAAVLEHDSCGDAITGQRGAYSAVTAPWKLRLSLVQSCLHDAIHILSNVGSYSNVSDAASPLK